MSRIVATAIALLFLAHHAHAAVIHTGGIPASPPTAGEWLLVHLEPLQAPSTFKGSVGVESVNIVNNTLWVSNAHSTLDLQYDSYLTTHDLSQFISDGSSEVVVGIGTPANGEQVFRYEWGGGAVFVTKAASIASTPEPASWVLALMPAVALLRRRREVEESST